LTDADKVVFLQRPELPWDAQKVTAALDGRAFTAANVDDLLAGLIAEVRRGDHVVFMSNGGFEAAPLRFAALLRAR
jgi:UDP-N-acetylmuramate: L-alanyl-gamma-D-glutamyl-meso-diaminopimelate ligase